jgi:hypothetical protein
MKPFSLAFALAALVAALSVAGCEGATEPDFGDDDGASDGDADGDADADADSDSDGDTDIPTETGPIEPDCSGCSGIGNTLPNMLCAIDMCDPNTFISQDYTSPTGSTLAGTAEGVAHFGNPSNDLAPLLNGSYALMASGPANGTSHSQDMGGGALSDPFSSDGYQIHNAFEWKLNLRAPAGAHGFQVHYVFFSEEYDEWVASSYNDKFYIFLEAGSTNGGQKTVINYTDCRDPGTYFDFNDANCDTQSGYCCYVAINTSLSECCWYPKNSSYAPNPGDPPCPQGTWTTDISGTGYSCAANVSGDSASTGSSTGWLKTEWPISPNEEFTLTFHIHDTSDGVWDSEVILDKVLFVGTVEQGTTPVY